MPNIIPYCFTKNDILKEFDNVQQYNNWIYSRLKKGTIKQVRKGLYVSVDTMGNIFSTKFEIASHISETTFIAYHSALEYYGLANQVFNDMIIGSISRFNPFEFDGVGYLCKVIKNYEQVNFIPCENIRIASLERTIVDCIDNIALAGGIEEVLNALEQVKVLDENKILNILKSYNNVLLYQKVGFILEQYQNQLSLSNEFFNECKKHLTNQIKYFLQDEYKYIEFNSTWKLMAPKDIKSRINGGY